MEVMPNTNNLLVDLGKAVDENIRDFVKWFDSESGFLLSSVGLGPTNCGSLRPGDAVHVWSNTTQRWVPDGVVREIAAADVVVDAHRVVPKGSVHVVFKGGTGDKWVLPKHAPRILKVGGGGGGGMAKQAVRQIPTPMRPAIRPVPIAPVARRPPPAMASDNSFEAALVNLMAIEVRCNAQGRLFEDPEFPPQLYGKVKRWCRPRELTAHAGRPLGGLAYEIFGISPSVDWQLFRGAPRADDVQQGELGDCWLISSLSALAEYRGGRHVRSLLPGQERTSRAGAYLVRLCLGGRWRSLLVDDCLPCLEDEKSAFCTQLAYCEAHRLQLWASIVEKGLAKACGSYAALRKGQAGEALSILTGWPCTQISLDRPIVDADTLWATLCSAKQAGFLLACGTYQVRAPSLQSFHIYTLLDLIEVEADLGLHVRLLKIRNPQATSKWEGAWSDASEQWTPALRQKLGCPVGGTAGVFFISLGDFLANFGHCTICRIRSEWYEVRRELCLWPGEPPQHAITFQAAETAECCITLAQPEERLRRGPLYKDHSLPLASLGFALLETPCSSSERPTVVAVGRLRQRAMVSADCWLQAGQSYTLVPVSENGTTAIEASFALHTSRPLELAEELAPVLGPGATAAALDALGLEEQVVPQFCGPHFLGCMMARLEPHADTVHG